MPSNTSSDTCAQSAPRPRRAAPAPAHGQTWTRTSGAKRGLIGNSYTVSELVDNDKTVLYLHNDKFYTIPKDKFLSECTFSA